jgi:hypothetical protein
VTPSIRPGNRGTGELRVGLTERECRFWILRLREDRRSRKVVAGEMERAVEGAPRKLPGVSASVYDSAYDRVIAVYRSEEAPTQLGRLGMRELPVRPAREHVKRLNAWAREVAA